jgi:hypothetical protein
MKAQSSNLGTQTLNPDFLFVGEISVYHVSEYDSDCRLESCDM